jgi:GGDEF domain-containing protein
MENTRRYRRLRDMANRDSLTGLYNQRYLFRSLKNLILAPFPGATQTRRKFSRGSTSAHGGVTLL